MAAAYAGCVLLLETSEEMPTAEETFRMLRNFGERGLLAQFPAILVATAKAAGSSCRAAGRAPAVPGGSAGGGAPRARDV